jgi:hypothetical protein
VRPGPQLARRSVLLRLGLSFATAFGVAILVALAITIIDLYLTGHGHASIGREILTWPQAGVHLSLADILMLIAAVATGVGVWCLTGGPE